VSGIVGQSKEIYGNELRQRNIFLSLFRNFYVAHNLYTGLRCNETFGRPLKNR